VRASALAVLLWFASTHAGASPESERLVRRGLMEFEAQRYRDAIYFFGEAVKADPKDLHAVFLQGAALNRLGNYREAYLLIRGVENQGAKHPEMDFEAGWALMGMGRARACVERLERFEKTSPGRGQTAEFLGRCYLQLGELEQAEKYLRLAIEREPRLKPSIDLSLARLERARNRPDAAHERLQAAAAANSPTGRALREILGLPEPVFQPERPLRLGASLAIGHNDNVIGLGNTIPLPADITRKDANFLRAAANAAYTRALTTATSASVGYAGLLDRYDDLAAANLNDHFFYADLLHVLPRRIGISLRLSHQYTEVSGDEFRDQSTLRPALSYRFTENSVTELAYAYAVADYHFPVAFDQFDRDGHVKGFSLVHQFRVPRSPWSGAFGVTHTRNRTRGSDFSFDANGASASASYAFTREVSAGVGVAYTRSKYLNPNSLSISTPFDEPFAREDEAIGLSAQLAGPLAFGLRWFAQAQHLTNDSNIPFFHFRQNVVSAGIAASY
jgi:tetratricopeptide (TPR) repeat protein